jgi:hypothetical protein
MNFLVRIFAPSVDSTGETESGYFVAEPNETEALLTALDLHDNSLHMHDSSVDQLDIDVSEHSSGSAWYSTSYTPTDDLVETKKWWQF